VRSIIFSDEWNGLLTVRGAALQGLLEQPAVRRAALGGLAAFWQRIASIGF
jgi:hypothetical protein